jgi:hypothetical protein
MKDDTNAALNTDIIKFKLQSDSILDQWTEHFRLATTSHWRFELINLDKTVFIECINGGVELCVAIVVFDNPNALYRFRLFYFFLLRLSFIIFLMI